MRFFLSTRLSIPATSWIVFLLLATGLFLQAAAAPTNDTFSTPTLISGIPVAVNGSNVEATIESGEPIPPDLPVGGSVWFQWTATESSVVRMSTVGSNFDTVLSVWTGDQLGNLVEIVTNNDSSGELSAVRLDAVTGVTYRIAVYGYLSDQGAITLSINYGGKIAGQVTGADSLTPLESIEVQAYFWNDEDDYDQYWETSVTTDTLADGTYLMEALEPGIYRVRFLDPEGAHLTEYFDNTAVFLDADDITVEEAATAAGIDASLANAARITGTITGPDGTTPLEGIDVTVFQWNIIGGYWDYMIETHTLADGSYSAGGLLPGSYRVGFFDYRDRLYANEYYANAESLDTATEIVVPAESVVSNINASLATASRITGKVTGPDGLTPLENIQVNFSRWNELGGFWSDLSGTSTSADGTYSSGGIAPGTYRVSFSDNYYWIYVDEYFDDMASFEDASDIAVLAESVVGGIDASLSEKAAITGKVTALDGVTPLEGIQVRAYYWDEYDENWYTYATTPTLADGTYRLAGLNANSYRIRFLDPNGDHLTEYYDNALTIDLAESILVGSSSDVTTIDASLATSSQIAGIVTGQDGITPLSGILVRVFVWNGAFWDDLNETFTSNDGSYVIDGLAADTYRVGFFDQERMYINEYFDDVSSLNAASDIIVATESVVSGIDASLGILSRITGTVTGPDGTTPLENVRVEVYRWDNISEYWELVSDAFTLANGSYSAGGLAAGNYRVGFSDFYGHLFADEYFSEALTLDGAIDIAVPAETVVSGIDASLVPVSRITGRVTRGDGITPLEGIDVRIFRLDEASGYWFNVAFLSSSADGQYSSNGLDPGKYRVGFFDYRNEVYSNKYYGDATSFSEATDIVVLAETVVSGINASLEERGSIIGEVTGPDGITPLEGVQVRAFYWDQVDGQWYTYATTYSLADGTYRIPSMVDGTYRIRFLDQVNGNPTEYYNDVLTIEGASDVVVVAGVAMANINASLGTAISIPGTITGFQMTGTGSYEMNFSGISGNWYRVQRSMDLKVWTDVGVPFQSEAGGDVIPLASGEDIQFWRVRTEP